MALTLAVDHGVNINDRPVGALPLLHGLYRHGNAVRDLLGKETQRLFPQHLGGDDPLRLVGQHVVVKVVWPLNGGLVQQLPQERYPVAGLGA